MLIVRDVSVGIDCCLPPAMLFSAPQVRAYLHLQKVAVRRRPWEIEKAIAFSVGKYLSRRSNVLQSGRAMAHPFKQIYWKILIFRT